MNTYDGSIEVIFGPMFSGKSTELNRRIFRHKLTNKNVILIKYIHNTRKNEENNFSNLKDEEFICNDLFGIENNLLDNIDIIGIDEGQFFENISEFCEVWANKGKLIIVSSLDSTFERKNFKEINKIISISENITKLYAVCNICGKNASFTKRIDESKELMLVGGLEKYISCCRKCYFN